MDPTNEDVANNPDITAPQPQAFGPQPEPAPSQPAAEPYSSVPPLATPAATNPQPPVTTSPSEPAVPPVASAAIPGPGVAPSQPQPQVFGPQQTASASHTMQSPVGGYSPATPPQYASSQQLSPAPKRKLPGKKLFIGLAAVLLVGFGGSAFAYINIMNNSPEKVLADAYANTVADLINRKPARVVSALRLQSTDETNPYTVDIDTEAKQVNESGQIGATIHVKAGQDFDLTVTGSAIIEGSETLYVKFENLQKTLNQIVAMNAEFEQPAQVIKPLLQKIEGRWIKIDKESLKDLGLEQTDVDVDECSEALKSLRISDDDKGRFKEIFKQHPFAIASEELPAERIDGDASFHYKLDLNEEAAIRFIKEVIGLESFANAKQKCEFSQEDFDKSLEEAQKNTDQEVSTKPIIELWVSKKTRYMTKVKITINDKEVSADWTATTSISDDITIEIPSDTMSVRDVQREIEALATQVPESGMTQGWSAWRR